MNPVTATALAGLSMLALAMDSNLASADDPLQTQIDAIIAEYGGEQTAPNQISWDDGEAVLTIPTDISAKVVGKCATGKFCAYSAINQAGLSISFTNCTATNSTAPIGSVRSVSNARSSATVRAYNGSSVVLTIAAGSTTNTGKTITRLGC